MAEARLPAGKTLAAFDFESAPMVSKVQVMALASGDVWLNNEANLLFSRPAGGGATHARAIEPLRNQLERRLEEVHEQPRQR